MGLLVDFEIDNEVMNFSDHDCHSKISADENKDD